MQLAAVAAPEIDRLVWAVNTRVDRDHRDEIDAIAEPIGIETVFPLQHYAAFLLAGRLTRDVATLRMRYMPADRVNAQIDTWLDAGLIADDGGVLSAGAAIRPLLELLRARRAEIAATLWSEEIASVEEASSISRRVIDGATADFTVAAAHRSLPDPSDPFLLFHQRLVTLRYIRQQAHADAWLERGLDAFRIVAMTQLWHGETVEAAPEALGGLEEAGYVAGDPPALTPRGQQVREDIEADTNLRTQPAFDVLDDETGTHFVALLRGLPGEAV